MKLKLRREFLLSWLTDRADPESNYTFLGVIAGTKDHLEIVRHKRLEPFMTIALAGPYGGFKGYALVDPDELLAEVTKAVTQFKELQK